MDDNDDIFHDIVMAEEIHQRSGFEEGYEAGKAVGIQTGNKLGWEKGAAIGSEVGFYGGFSKTLLEDLKRDPDAKQRAVKALERIAILAQDFPLTDPLNPDLQAKLEEIRTKFKLVCSLLGIKPESNKEENKGISF